MSRVYTVSDVTLVCIFFISQIFELHTEEKQIVILIFLVKKMKEKLTQMKKKRCRLLVKLLLSMRTNLS